MNKFQIGKMYLVKELFWLLYPTKEVAAGAMKSRMLGGCGSRAMVYQYAKWLRESFSCNFCVVEENTCFVLLEKDNDYFKVLDSNGNIGWIWCNDFSKYFELAKDLE